MKKAPYLLSEAQEICKEFQHLSGQQFDKDTSTSIDGVIVTPFGEESKKRFFLYYLLFNDAAVALQQECQGVHYDVVALAGANDGYELLQEDVYSWLAKNKRLPLHKAAISEFAPQAVSLTVCQ
jgi:hypothetical protein